MIEAVKIGPVTYAVKLKDDLHIVQADGSKSALHGHILWAPAEIRIDRDQSEDRKLITLWHEALHGILENAGQNDHPEALIQALGFGVVQLLRDNPALVRFTMGWTDGD